MLQRIVRAGFVLVLSAVLIGGGIAAPLESAIDTQAETEQAAAKSQRKVDALSEETAELLVEYRQVTAQLDSLRTYNRQLEKLIRSQKEEFASLQRQLEGIDITQREIVPLMLRMVSALKQFVALDLPFLPEERQARIEQLKALMDRADVSLAEKYRRLIEAYQVEVEYGRTIEAYRGKLETKDKPRTVDFLRIGRTALFFHTLDGKTCGHWDVQKRRWVSLPDRYRAAITKGLRIAHKQAPPDLLILPLRAPEVIQ
jgi:septal ring factor EnvC (AmiA/AmiB activator)